MSTTTTFKVALGSETRRFTYTGDAAPTMAWLNARLAVPCRTSFIWTDEDGDTITITDDGDLREAVSSQGSPVRLTAAATAAADDDDEPTTAGEPSTEPSTAAATAAPLPPGSDDETPEHAASDEETAEAAEHERTEAKLQTLASAVAAAVTQSGLFPGAMVQCAVHGGLRALRHAHRAAKLGRGHGRGRSGGRVHPGVVCDKSGQTPIKGARFRKVGEDYDLCLREFKRLDGAEKEQYEVIWRSGADPVPFAEWVAAKHRKKEAHRAGGRKGRLHHGPGGGRVHPGVVCDASGQAPIRGARFHKVGEDYDLCRPEFDKLDDAEKERYEVIWRPGADPVPFAEWAELKKHRKGGGLGGPGGCREGGGLGGPGGCRVRGRHGHGHQHGEPALAGGAVAVHVGGSGHVTKTVRLPEPGPGGGWAVSAEPVNRQHPGWNDTFEVRVDGDLLHVTRTDAALGWGQPLVLAATPGPGRHEVHQEPAPAAVPGVVVCVEHRAPKEPPVDPVRADARDGGGVYPDLAAADAAADVEHQSKWATELELLDSMGFARSPELVALLEKHRGSLNMVIASLLG